MILKFLMFSSSALVFLLVNPSFANANFSTDVDADVVEPSESHLTAEIDQDQSWDDEDLEIISVPDSEEQLESWLEEIESENSETVYIDEQGNEYYLPTEEVAGPSSLRKKKRRGSARGCVAADGQASWYGPGFNGKKTANGERFNQNALTAAHKGLKFGSRVKVTYHGRSVVVRINDAGPYVAGRVIDLSKAAAQAIGLIGAGHGSVTLEVLSCG